MPQHTPADEVNARPADTACSYFYFLRAKTDGAEGRLEEARESYEQALLCDPRAVYLMRSLAVLLAQTGNFPDAVALLDEIRLLQPGNIETLTFLANIYAALERPVEAIALYREILRRDPRNFHAVLLLGTIHARNRQYEEAREVLQELVQTDPDSYIGQLYLGKLHQELHEFDKALACYHRALALNWSEGLAFEVAELYEQLGRHQEAAALYSELLARDDTSERARGGLIGIHLQLGEVDQALAELEKLRVYATDVQKVDFTIGQLLLQQERHEEASRKFAGLLAADPELATARYLLAYIYFEQGNLLAARELILPIPAEAPVYDDATLLLIRILEEGDDPVAFEHFLREKLTTRRPVFYLALAAFYQEQEQPERGSQVYGEALDRFPDDPLVLLQYGMFLERQGQSEEAMAQMQKVLVLEPGNPYALNYVGYTWADQGINLQEALRYIQEAVALRPEDGFIRDSLGWVYFRLGEMDKALVELENAIELEPEDPYILEHLGDVYVEHQKFEQAWGAYLRAMELFDREDRQEEVRRKLEEIQL
jgi:tetratricopeptide (TPR) repeat protein